MQSGWAEAGVCVRLTSEEAGVNFLPVQEVAYDLCVPDSLLDDPRIRALTRVLRSTTYHQLLATLTGYDTSETGALGKVS